MVEHLSIALKRGIELTRQLKDFGIETTGIKKDLFINDVISETINTVRILISKSITIEQNLSPHTWIINGNS